MTIEFDQKVNGKAAGKPKLLLADDSVTIRKVVELTFADEGVDVTTVPTGEEAMLKFVEIEPDIVMLDVNMPDPTGYQICEMIKQDEATGHIPVLLMVGSFEPFDQDEAERVGADGFIVKPFQSIRDLVAKVNELLGPEKEAIPPVPETNDIESLYEKSFAETYKMDDEGTNDIFLGNAGMDDEIIEMSHPSGDQPEPLQVEKKQEELEDDLDPLSLPVDDADVTFEGFDWAARPAGDEPAVEEPEPPANGDPEPLSEDVPVLDLDEVDTLRDIEVEPEPAHHTAEIEEPSDEFITLVARRVVEKLSDRVIREIAKDAVPRIAENLIREALQEENKKE